MLPIYVMIDSHKSFLINELAAPADDAPVLLSVLLLASWCYLLPRDQHFTITISRAGLEEGRTGGGGAGGRKGGDKGSDRLPTIKRQQNHTTVTVVHILHGQYRRSNNRQ